MNKQPPSIFNDVIGPVMRGPSSSHVAASARIGKLATQLLAGKLKQAIIEFETNGAIAPTYHGHGTDIGLVGGLLGYAPEDRRVPHSLDLAEKQGIEIKFQVKDFTADHPNTMKINLESDYQEVINLTAISTGGGLIEITEIEGLSLSICGDFHETLLFFEELTSNEIQNMVNKIENLAGKIEYLNLIKEENRGLIELKTTNPLTQQKIDRFLELNGITNIKQLSPVMPVLSRKECQLPFNTTEEMLAYCQGKSVNLWELAVLYEKHRGSLKSEEVISMMKKIMLKMKSSIKIGLARTSYEDRILGSQSWMIKKAENEDKLLPGGLLNNVISQTMAVMESKSSMEVILAAPTAGSCGVVPGAIIGSADYMELDDDAIVKSLLSAGIMGVFISKQATFAAEACGCQAECGAGSAMAAAGLVQLANGTVEQAVNAASIALQNILGLICDPVANRVEVPCLGRNVMAASNALAAANMALAGVNAVIPFDEVVEAMYQVGLMLPSELRCTGRGGLSLSKTACAISKKINNK